MAWDSVPWFIGGGAQHSPEVARVLSYAAFRGNEGILGPLDLAVKALTVPGGSVTVDPGVVTILSRATGGAYQAYSGRLATQDTLAIPATGGSARSDLIVARVEDPYMAGEPWSDPTDPTTGPYIFTRRIPGVPNTTKDVASLGLGYSAIALARVDIPASTGTITQAMITDLRKVANPRRERDLIAQAWGSTNTLTASSYTEWPTGAHWSIAVPTWATQIKILATWAQILTPSTASNPSGGLLIAFGSLSSSTVAYDTTSNTGASRSTYVCGDRLAIPWSMRGTTQTLTLKGTRGAGTGAIQADSYSALSVDYEFSEIASAT
jgi:hypothetical protein